MRFARVRVGYSPCEMSRMSFLDWLAVGLFWGFDLPLLVEANALALISVRCTLPESWLYSYTICDMSCQLTASLRTLRFCLGLASTLACWWLVLGIGFTPSGGSEWSGPRRRSPYALLELGSCETICWSPAFHLFFENTAFPSGIGFDVGSLSVCFGDHIYPWKQENVPRGQ